MGMDEKSWVWLKETKATRLFSLFVTEYAPLMNFHEVRPLETTCTRIGESPPRFYMEHCRDLAHLWWYKNARMGGLAQLIPRPGFMKFS